MPISLNRATVVYLCIFAVFCVGIWMILSLGSAYLVAPPDLSGQWHFDSPANSASNSPSNSLAAKRPDDFQIHQSGKYVQLLFPQKGQTVNLVQTACDYNAQPPTVTLKGQGWEVSAAGPVSPAAPISTEFAGAPRYQFTFAPPPTASAADGAYLFYRADDSAAPSPQSLAKAAATQPTSHAHN